MNKATDVIRNEREKYSTLTFIWVCRLQLCSPKELTDLLNRQNYAWIQLFLTQSLRSHGRLKYFVTISWTGEEVATHGIRNHALQCSYLPWIPSFPRARTVLINIKCRSTYVKSCQETHILTTYVYCRLPSTHLVRLLRCFSTSVPRYITYSSVMPRIRNLIEILRQFKCEICWRTNTTSHYEFILCILHKT
jgi:hypothetical protein